MDKLISIVIPTKDRYYYLKKVIELIEGFKSDEIEIIIQDNSSDNREIIEFLNDNSCPCTRYFHESGQIPMSTNADKAILHSSGKYVCFIGDDDGVTPYVVECAKWMERKGIDAVLPATVNYIWPDAIRRKAFAANSKLFYTPFSGKCASFSAFDELKRLIDEGLTNRGKLPRVYHGVVSRAALNKIYEHCSTFFPGSSPDISNAVALALVVDKYCIVDMPITISGASKFHGGGTDLIPKKYPDLADIPWLLPEAIEKWDKRIPPKGIGISLWADSAIKALQAMDRQDLVEDIKFDDMYSIYISAYPSLKGMVYPLAHNKVKVFVRSNLILFKRYCNAFKRLIIAKIHLHSDHSHSHVFSSMSQVVDYLMQHFLFSFPD